MPFHDSIRQILTSDEVHANIVNPLLNQLLENTKQNKDDLSKGSIAVSHTKPTSNPAQWVETLQQGSASPGDLSATVEFVEQKIREVKYLLSVLETERGYLTSYDMTNTNPNLIIENGKYIHDGTGMPVKGIWLIDVTARSSTWVHQRARCMYDQIGQGYTGVTVERDSTDGNWGQWSAVAKSSDVVNRTNGDALGYMDGRSMKPAEITPGYYSSANRKNGMCIQLMTADQLGIIGEYGLVHLITTIPWDDHTGIVIQFAHSVNGNTYRRMGNNNPDSWQNWIMMARYFELAPPLLNGWGIDGGLRLFRIGDMAYLHGSLTGTKFDPGTQVMQIPHGYRIGLNNNFKVFSSHASGSTQLMATPDGIISIGDSGAQYIKLEFGWRVEG